MEHCGCTRIYLISTYVLFKLCVGAFEHMPTKTKNVMARLSKETFMWYVILTMHKVPTIGTATIMYNTRAHESTSTNSSIGVE